MPPKKGRDQAGRFQPGKSGNPKGRPRKARQDSAPVRSDGWYSLLTGMGTSSHDKRYATTFGADVIDPETATDIWRGDDIGARIVETLPHEALREGYTLQIPGERDLSETIMGQMEDLGLAESLERGWQIERALGGAGVLLGINDSRNISEPVNWDGIRSLDWITVLECGELQPYKYYNDPRDKNFGRIATFQMMPITQGVDYKPTKTIAPIEVHSSRVLVFPGKQVSRRQRVSLSGWGDSIFTLVFRVLRDYHTAYNSTAILLNDFAQAVFKIKGLADYVSLENKDILRTRMEAVELSRSTARAVLIDADEEFERKTTPVTGLPDLLDRYNQRLAAAAETPLTVLMGVSPGGLNATGESDMRIFYDRTRGKQNSKLRPLIEYVVRILFKANKVRTEPNAWTVKFNSLWQPTEKEQAETRYAQAKTDEIYINSNVVSPEEIAISRFGGDEWSAETKVDFEEREKIIEEIGLEKEEPEPGIQLQPMGDANGQEVNEGDPEAAGSPTDPEGEPQKQTKAKVSKRG